MARTKEELRAEAARRPPETATRAERHAPLRKGPTKRALRGTQRVGRHDMERGVTSRARKSVEGRETVPDPRYGGRPGQRKSKWSPRRALLEKATLMSARERAGKPPLPARRVHVWMERALYDKVDRIAHAERIRTRNRRVTVGRIIADIVRAYAPPRETARVMGRLARAGRELV